MRRLPAFVVGLVLLVPPSAAHAGEDPPVPEVNFAGQVTPARPCTAEQGNTYEAQQYADEGWGASPRYTNSATLDADDCRRLRFVFGPIHTKPGQNDVLIEPVTIAKPAFDGYVVRFEPNLVDATGRVPGVHEIHLHHAVWLNVTDNYGNGVNPFFGVGEEKTILNLPRGFGLPVRATDTWQILYMIHNQFPAPTELFITYELDIIPAQAAKETWGMKPVYPIWLDVRPSFYPVFNAKRNFPASGATTCTWPTQNCADHDPWGRQTWNQGCTNPQYCSPPNNTFQLPDTDGGFGRVTNFTGGTLVHIAGHLHPGGLTVQVELERSGQTPRRIFTSEGVYWNHTDHVSRNGPPTSWDMSMTAAGLPEWGIRVEPKDRFRIKATYDVAEQSTYENMGIAVAWIAPHEVDDDQNVIPTAPGLNPFTSDVDTAPTCPSGGLLASTPKLCDKGEVTHGHLPEAQVYGGINASTNLEAAAARPRTNGVSISGFQYVPGDHDTIGLTGIPSVPLGQSVRFVNTDAAADIYHSVTSCRYPCDGSLGIAYPLADGRSDTGNAIDFDSGELGFGPSFGGENVGPAKNTNVWQLQVSDQQFDPGVYTFFCRVHPFMRGALAVTSP